LIEFRLNWDVYLIPVTAAHICLLRSFSDERFTLPRFCIWFVCDMHSIVLSI